jgi:hypothetical protein
VSRDRTGVGQQLLRVELVDRGLAKIVLGQGRGAGSAAAAAAAAGVSASGFAPAAASAAGAAAADRLFFAHALTPPPR